jgi:hypothetical protein
MTDTGHYIQPLVEMEEGESLANILPRVGSKLIFPIST